MLRSYLHIVSVALKFLTVICTYVCSNTLIHTCMYVTMYVRTLTGVATNGKYSELWSHNIKLSIRLYEYSVPVYQQ